MGARADHPRRVPAAVWEPTTCIGSRAGPIRVVERGCRRHTGARRPGVTPWEQAAAFGAREVERVVAEVGADAVLAGAGVANLAAWVAVGRARAAGSRVTLDGRARPVGLRADTGRPLHLQPPGVSRDAAPERRLHRLGHGHRGSRYPDRGLSRGRPGGSHRLPELDRTGRGSLPGGVGWGNDVASRATACVVVTLARPERLPETVAYVTSPGHRVVSVVTDLGILRRHDGTLRVAAVPAGEGIGGRPDPGPGRVVWLRALTSPAPSTSWSRSTWARSAPCGNSTANDCS